MHCIMPRTTRQRFSLIDASFPIEIQLWKATDKRRHFKLFDFILRKRRVHRLFCRIVEILFGVEEIYIYSLIQSGELNTTKR